MPANCGFRWSTGGAEHRCARLELHVEHRCTCRATRPVDVEATARSGREVNLSDSGGPI